MRKVTGLRCLYATVAAVALGFSAEYVNAQEEAPLPATPTPPPGVQEREKVAKPPAHPGKSPEVDELLQKIRLTRADIEKRKADKAEKQLPATAEEPPNVKERKKVEKPPAPPGRSPNLDELIEKIKKQPGGAEKLERAKRGGARIPPGGAGGATLESSLERTPGPWVEGPVFGLTSAADQQTTLRVTKPAAYQNVAGLGELSGYEITSWTAGWPGAWGPLYRVAVPNYPITGNLDVRPFLGANVNVTNPGWYLINLFATRGKASLRKCCTTSGTPPMFALMIQWDHSASANYWESYPYLVNLAAGWHYFYWVPDQPGSWHYVAEVSVMKL
jgi:hypothetical protein